MKIEEEGAEWGIRKRTETEKEEVDERARLCYLAIELYPTTKKPSLDITSTTLAIFFLPRPLTLTYDLERRT